MSSFKSNENIQKKEYEPDRSVSDNQSSSVNISTAYIIIIVNDIKLISSDELYGSRPHKVSLIRPSDQEIIWRSMTDNRCSWATICQR